MRDSQAYRRNLLVLVACLLLAIPLGGVTLASPSDGVSPDGDIEFAVCISTSPDNLVSISPSGMLTDVRGSGDTNHPFPKVRRIQLSEEEVSDLATEAEKITRVLKPLVMEYETEVISISEDPEAPRSGRVQPGKIAMRIWLGGESWEFYGTRADRNDESSISPGIRIIDRKISSILNRAAALTPEEGESMFLVITDSPENYFITGLHEQLVPGGKVAYMGETVSENRTAEIVSVIENLRYPGTWHIADARSIAKIAELEEFVTETEFLENFFPPPQSHKSLSEIEDYLLREKLKASVTIMEISP
jgi:hypothetical protein